jgi:hypothetical protein
MKKKEKVTKILEDWELYFFICVLGAPYYQGGGIQ